MTSNNDYDKIHKVDKDIYYYAYVGSKEFTESRIATRREYVDKIKSQPCVDCEQTFPPCAMDFDHVSGDKVTEVSRLYTASWKKLLEEIAKCDLVCSNCHRIRTQQRMQGLVGE